MENNKENKMGMIAKYYVKSDDGKSFFPTPEKFLEYLRNNDESECGCEMLTPAQVMALDGAGPDEYIDYESIK